MAHMVKDLVVAPETLRRRRDKADVATTVESGRVSEKTMVELKRLRAENVELRRANEILTMASAFSRRGSARHGIEGRMHQRLQCRVGVGPREVCRDQIRHVMRISASKAAGAANTHDHASR